MTTNAVPNFGSELRIGPVGQPLVSVSELLSLTPPQDAVEMIKVTSHDSAEDEFGAVPEEFIPEPTYDPGDIVAKIHYLAGSAIDEALLLAKGSRAKQEVKILGKATAGKRGITGNGYVLAYTPDEQPLNGVKTATLRIKRTGAWTRVSE